MYKGNINKVNCKITNFISLFCPDVFVCSCLRQNKLKINLKLICIFVFSFLKVTLMSSETPSIHPSTLAEGQQFAQLSSEQTPNVYDVMPTGSSSTEPAALQAPAAERIGLPASSSP